MTVDLRQIGAVFAGGVLGALARTGLVELWPVRLGHWPWVTLVVNVVGCFLLGYFATRLQERLPLSAYRRPLLGTGLCGALTTFSTVQLELVQMCDHGRPGAAALYAAVSVGAGFAAMVCATSIVRRVRLIP